MDALILRASPNSLSAIRSLGRAGLHVTVAAPANDPAIRWSRYVTRFVPLPDISERAVEVLLSLPFAGAEKPFLLPTGDEDALLVAKHREPLAAQYCFVLPDHDVLEGIVDKARLYETARAHGVPHPRFHVVRRADDIDDAVEAVGTPCYVKPAMAHEWRRQRRGKLERASDAADLRQILRDFIAHDLTAIPVEIVPGNDGDVHSVSTYIDSGGKPVAWRTKRKLRQFPVDAGDGSAQEITDVRAVADSGLRLLAHCGHRGPATVEFRRDARDGRFVLMEINARTILGQEMITRSGLDAPLLAWHDATNRPLPAVGPARRVRWVFLGPDYRSFRELRRRGVLSFFGWLQSVARCRSFAYFAWDDPAPFLARLGLWCGRFFRGRFRRTHVANL
jgi:D-aspartate ligase